MMRFVAFFFSDRKKAATKKKFYGNSHKAPQPAYTLITQLKHTKKYDEQKRDTYE